MQVLPQSSVKMPFISMMVGLAWVVEALRLEWDL